MDALRIAIVGAESTGKSTLAAALARRLAEEFGLRAVCVPEILREWCDARGRTPTAGEQWDIARAQQRAIDEAAPASDVVLCDTTPLMTAVYSRMVFDDGALDPFARDAHAGIAFTLLTALDLPWIADGLQRDGPHVREPVDSKVRAALRRMGMSYAVVAGVGGARFGAALAAVRRVIHPPSVKAAQPRWQWHCERCGDASCERTRLPPASR